MTAVLYHFYSKLKQYDKYMKYIFTRYDTYEVQVKQILVPFHAQSSDFSNSPLKCSLMSQYFQSNSTISPLLCKKTSIPKALSWTCVYRTSLTILCRIDVEAQLLTKDQEKPTPTLPKKCYSTDDVICNNAIVL